MADQQAQQVVWDVSLMATHSEGGRVAEDDGGLGEQ